ncbi:Gene 36 protein (Gp36), probable excisionase [Mycobacteroides abscessus subsp. massiliense]|uniref:helix-turn-helix transcriptional regulator n=1 Tax=Mycobacteroides abscessus TaxID=36809 RepID=UPI0009A7868A|nr:helix-turn-helix domain-containing protein [Mycobacteroides abscessus]SLG78248.1 Gene 36 protein (Gp36), probable excisionase [Mycobacteroides abscessus subsp. massiliense]SLI16813.1 Gene 36 protein (Gp36), probable excisionase [Mycobacteroides abscessus subsp. massiliense]
MRRSTPTTHRRLISLTAAAERLDVCPRTMRRYIAAGRLTAYRIGPRLIKVDVNEIDQLLTVIA